MQGRRSLVAGDTVRHRIEESATPSASIAEAGLSGGKPISVVHVIGATLAGGAERFVVSLALLLKSMHIDVTVMALSNRSDVVGDEMRKSLLEAGIALHLGPTERVGISSVLWYRQCVERLAPNVVHLHIENTEVAHFLSHCLGLSRVKLCRTIHNVAKPEQFLAKLAYRYNHCEHSIACSEAVGVVGRGMVSGKIDVILNGVEFNYPIQTEALRSENKRALNWDPMHCHFLQVGRMTGATLASEQKAHDLVLAAWREGGLGGLGCVLHLVGGGNLRSDLERLAGKDRSVIFHGVCANVPSYLMAADCYLMPSRFEGMPIAGIEAVGAGIPCIFTTIGPLRELHPPEVLWMSVDDKAALIANLREYAVRRPVICPGQITAFRESFSIAKAASAYADIYAGMAIGAVERVS